MGKNIIKKGCGFERAEVRGRKSENRLQKTKGRKLER